METLEKFRHFTQNNELTNNTEDPPAPRITNHLYSSIFKGLYPNQGYSQLQGLRRDCVNPYFKTYLLICDSEIYVVSDTLHS